ncbi:hypothetical protein FA15DRAFT_259927 [Coprinopsis marcescibilis]|uniref:Uncharacterized protein n=1 Tax=Coprinopsis marcescibilis TaxID=230819 RepID=A0A5C3KEP3_COPMA|nr:hypothetical protein FA15DRAFT_259927 [Coprinopsis marcescibilis]
MGAHGEDWPYFHPTSDNAVLPSSTWSAGFAWSTYRISAVDNVPTHSGGHLKPLGNCLKARDLGISNPVFHFISPVPAMFVSKSLLISVVAAGYVAAHSSKGGPNVTAAPSGSFILPSPSGPCSTQTITQTVAVDKSGKPKPTVYVSGSAGCSVVKTATEYIGAPTVVPSGTASSGIPFCPTNTITQTIPVDPSGSPIATPFPSGAISSVFLGSSYSKVYSGKSKSYNHDYVVSSSAYAHGGKYKSYDHPVAVSSTYAHGGKTKSYPHPVSSSFAHGTTFAPIPVSSVFFGCSDVVTVTESAYLPPPTQIVCPTNTITLTLPFASPSGSIGPGCSVVKTVTESSTVYPSATPILSSAVASGPVTVSSVAASGPVTVSSSAASGPVTVSAPVSTKIKTKTPHISSSAVASGPVTVSSVAASGPVTVGPSSSFIFPSGPCSTQTITQTVAVDKSGKPKPTVYVTLITPRHMSSPSHTRTITSLQLCPRDHFRTTHSH